jgi:hypothetical protein
MMSQGMDFHAGGWTVWMGAVRTLVLRLPTGFGSSVVRWLRVPCFTPAAANMSSMCWTDSLAGVAVGMGTF